MKFHLITERSHMITHQLSKVKLSHWNRYECGAPGGGLYLEDFFKAMR